MLASLGGIAVRHASSLPRFLAIVCAVACLALGAAAAHAGGKGKAVRTAGLHGKGGHGVSFGRQSQVRHGHFKSKRFHKHRKRPNVVRRSDRKRRPYYGSRYYYGSGYGRGTRYYYDPQPSPRIQSDPGPAAPSYRDRPVTPKWIHVGSLDGAPEFSGTEGAYGDGGFGNNCLSVKTQITVDGQAMDAFGEACLSADGAWVLRPSQDTQ